MVEHLLEFVSVTAMPCKEDQVPSFGMFGNVPDLACTKSISLSDFLSLELYLTHISAPQFQASDR